MKPDDKEELYEFITGSDAAGQNYMAKALADPRILVKTAWLALHGEKMLDQLTNYYKKEITKAKNEGYKKGKEDAQEKGQSRVVAQNSKPKKNDYFDIDDLD
jgi:flagellar biosynthesis/type III secretory pathway protein FliH